MLQHPKRPSYRWVVILLLLNSAGLISYFYFDFTIDNQFDMQFPTGLVLLVMIYGIGFVWYLLASRPYNYVR